MAIFENSLYAQFNHIQQEVLKVSYENVTYKAL